MELFTKDTIRKRQQWVKDHPARVKEELTATGYTFDLVIAPNFILRTVLSIDMFAAPLAWRAQIAFLYPSRLPRRMLDISLPQLMYAHHVAKSMLRGVGDASNAFLTKDALSFELAHPCTPDEAAHVVNAALRPAVELLPVPVGEMNEYDFSSKASQVAGWWDGAEGKQHGLYQPVKRSLIYERGTEAEQ